MHEVKVGDEVIFRAFTLAELDAMDFSGITAIRKAAVELVRELIPRCQSPIEKMFVEAWVEMCSTSLINEELFAAVADIKPQYKIFGYRLDFAFPKTKVAVELDGHMSHSSRENRTKDAARDRELTSDGWTVVRFTGTEIHRDVMGCAADLEFIIKRAFYRKQR